ncbi:MAG: glycogen synthase [Myxococcales bacterium]
MPGMRIAHLSAEVSPFAKTGGLGDVVGALPKYQAELGNDVSIWMPLYRQVHEWLGKRGQSPEWVTGPYDVEVGYKRYTVGLLRTFLPGSLVPVYLVGCDPLFDRPQVYSTDAHGRDDGWLRYAVFVRAALEGMRRTQEVPDVLNAHDWHTCLAPMALAWDRPRDWHFEKTVTTLTIHNAAYQGMYGPDTFMDLNLPREMAPGVMWRGALNLMKGGVMSAWAITAVSPTFAHEITTPDGGFGLDPILRHRRDDLVGILNGIDSQVWNPATDTRIPKTYDRDHLEGKLENRRALLSMAGMDPDDRNMVVGIVGRLTEQKGYDLLFPVLDDLLRDGIRFVMLGSGDERLEGLVHHYGHHARGRFWGYVGFSDDLAHLIEAGCDTFLMPSRFEPCGLSQLYSLAYGTPPIVRRTGGLNDTVIGYDGWNRDWATGFGFDSPDPHALRETVRWAHRCYGDMHLWTQLVRNGMAQDFSWYRSAEKYLDLYRKLLPRRDGHHVSLHG